MQAYKIKVENEAESKEAQKLFFELGYEWKLHAKTLTHKDKPFLFTESDGLILVGENSESFDEDKNKELTLPQLLDLVVLHRNDVGDATHEVIGNNDPLFITSEGELYYFHVTLNKWQKHGETATDLILSDYARPLKDQSKMTWQDALRAVADGKEVEFLSFENGEWEELATIHLGNIVDADCEFRLKPQTVFIDAGHYTKEELLKFAGEMA